MSMSIEEFYKTNSIDPDFDSEFYENEYRDTIDFYQPHCTQNKITNRARLFYHYFMYGREAGYVKHAESHKKKAAEQQHTALRVRGYTVSELLELLTVKPDGQSTDS